MAPPAARQFVGVPNVADRGDRGKLALKAPIGRGRGCPIPFRQPGGQANGVGD